MKIKPLHDRILIKEDEAAAASKGGIILPAGQERPPMGTVIAVGPGRYDNGTLIPVAVKEGDRVIFNKHKGSEIEIEGEEFRMIRDADIVGILD